MTQPGEQSRFVGVGRETADRSNGAPDLVLLTVDSSALEAGLESGAERPLSLVPTKRIMALVSPMSLLRWPGRDHR